MRSDPATISQRGELATSNEIGRLWLVTPDQAPVAGHAPGSLVGVLVGVAVAAGAVVSVGDGVRVGVGVGGRVGVGVGGNVGVGVGAGETLTVNVPRHVMLPLVEGPEVHAA